jgi:hypothetical protein
MRTAHIAVVAAAALSLSAVGGFAVAAGTTPRAVHACANSKGELKLLSKNGHCAKGYSKVTLDKTGPKGAPGPRGLRGLPGLAGPGAVASVATTTSTSAVADGPFVQVAGTDLSVSSDCLAADHATVTISGTSDYVARGGAQTALVGDATADTFHQIQPDLGQSTAIPNGASMIEYTTNSGSFNRTSDIATHFVSSGSAQLAITLLVTDGTATFAIDVFLSVDASACSATAQAIPTS